MKICRKYLIITIFCLFLIPPVFAKETGSIEYHDYLFNYSKINKTELKQEAESNLNTALSMEPSKERDNFLHKSMKNYHILLKIEPNTVEYMNKRGLIYDIMQKDLLAKSYFARALNLEKDNPETNFLVGDFFFKRNDYKRALRYFSAAYENGYNSFEINNKLAIVYEKLGDLCKAKEFYLNANSIDNNQDFLLEKIEGIPEENSEYHSS